MLLQGIEIKVLILIISMLYLPVWTYLFERAANEVEKIAEHLAAAVRCQTVPLDVLIA